MSPCSYAYVPVALLLISATTTVLANDQLALAEDFSLLYGDEETISIATGTKKPLHLAPSVTSVITADEIKAIGATNLDEALELIPGVHISRSFNRLSAITSIRGVHTGQMPQIRLSINGTAVRDLFTGGRTISFYLPVSNISRIEVIRGPGSAIHGADAFSGVINVVTKDEFDIKGTQAGGRIASFKSKNAWLLHSEEFKGWNTSFSMEYSITDGDQSRKVSSDRATAINAPSLVNDYPLQTRHNILNTQIKMTNDAWYIHFWNWYQRDSGTGPGAVQSIDPLGRTENDLYLLDIKHTVAQPVRSWEMEARYKYINQYRPNWYLLFPPGTILRVGDDGNIGTDPNTSCPDIPTPDGLEKMCLTKFVDGLHGNPGGDYDIHQLEFVGFNEQLSQHHIRLALGFNREKTVPFETKNFGPGTTAELVGETPADPVSGMWIIDGTLFQANENSIFTERLARNIYYLSLQDEWQLAADWEFTGGIRYDHYSDFGNTVNPRAALVWATRYNLTTKFLYGSAFRPPSFGELSAINNPSVEGNKDLKPEKIDTIELAFDYRPTFTLQHTLNFFSYQAKELIEYIPKPDNPQVSKAQNFKNIKGRGLELETRWEATEELDINFAFAIQHSEDMKTGVRIHDAPGRQYSISSLWRPDSSWTLFTSLNWVGDRSRAATDTRLPIDDYTQTNITLRKQVNKQLELAASVRNLFDEDIREPSDGRIPDDYPMEGRNLFVELNYKFDQ